jgi:protein YibB
MVLPQNLNDHAVRYWPQTEPGLPGTNDPVGHDSISVVTAFFDINRGDWNQGSSEIASKYQRSVDDYFKYFEYLAFLKNEMIVFIEPHLASRVLDVRRAAGLEDRTVIFTIDAIFDCPGVREVLAAISSQMTDGFRGFVWRPTAPEYNKADYVLINALKTSFVCTALDQHAIGAPQVAWIDFGYTRDPNCFDRGQEWRYFAGDKINLFNIFRLDQRPIYDIVRGGEVYFQGCHIIGPAGAWARFNRQISDALVSMLDCNLIDDDQTLMLMAWRRDPDAFIVHRRRIDPELDWRFVFRRFQTGLLPVDEDLPDVRNTGQPSWWRDLKNAARRRIRKWRRAAKRH